MQCPHSRVRPSSPKRQPRFPLIVYITLGITLTTLTNHWKWDFLCPVLKILLVYDFMESIISLSGLKSFIQWMVGADLGEVKRRNWGWTLWKYIVQNSHRINKIFANYLLITTTKIHKNILLDIYKNSTAHYASHILCKCSVSNHSWIRFSTCTSMTTGFPISWLQISNSFCD